MSLSVGRIKVGQSLHLFFGSPNWFLPNMNRKISNKCLLLKIEWVENSINTTKDIENSWIGFQ